MKKLYLLLGLLSVCSMGLAQKIPRFNPDTVLTVTIDSALLNQHIIHLDLPLLKPVH